MLGLLGEESTRTPQGSVDLLQKPEMELARLPPPQLTGSLEYFKISRPLELETDALSPE